ncbi:MAG: PAS domain S-box protein, partial [Deltaproteobacteria bacterium]
MIHSISRLEKDAEGKPIRVVGVIQDITRRKQGDIFRQLSTDVLGILSEPAELREVIVRVLNAIKQVTNADAVGLRLKTDDDFPYFVENGFSNDFLLKENTLVARDPDGGICRDSEGNVSLECTCGLVISGKTDPDNPLFTPGGSSWTNNSFPFLKVPEKDDPRFHPRNTCIHEGYASVALIPIRKNQQQIIGILQINAYKNDCFTPEIIQSLEQIAGHIGEALMRKQAEEAMRESEEKLAAIVAGSPVPKFVIDKDHKIIYWNRALEQTTGISAAQVMGTKKQWRAFYETERPTLADLILDEAFARISELYAGKFSKSPLVPGAFEATDFFPHMGEKGTYLRFMAAPIKNLHGDILGAVETLIDVSDIKRAEVELGAKNDELLAANEEITATEEELRANLDELTRQELALQESKKELSDIIEFLPDATFAINTKGAVIAWNHAMEIMTGVKPADILTKGNYEYSLPFYRERRPLLIDLVMGYDEQVAKKYPGIKKEGDKLIAEVYIPHLHNGRGGHLWFTSSPLYDSRGKISGAIESIREITEHKERESALNLKNEELSAAYEEITATEEELRQQVEEIATAHEALRETEQRYRNIVKDQTEFICRFMPDGTHVFVNDAYCRYFGVTSEDI